MAKDKNSFLLYCDIITMVEQLPDDKAGLLFKHILNYVNDKNPITEDLVINISFEPIKQALKRDLKKYESICNRNKTNGLGGGRPKNPEEPKKPSGLFGNPEEPKKPDSDSDSDSDIESEKENKEYDFIDPLFLESFNLWMKYKKDRKEKYRNLDSEKAFYRKLIRYSKGSPETAKLIIEESMANNWAGIFELKANSQQPTKTKFVA